MPNAYKIPDLLQVRTILSGVAPTWRFLGIMPEITKQVSTHYQFNPGGASYSDSGVNLLSSPQIPNATLQSVNVPPITIDTDSRFGQGTKISVARFVSTATITLNFYEDEYYSISKYLWAWHNMIVDEYNLHGLPSDYKKQISVWAFDSVNNNAPCLIVDFIDCFPMVSVNGLDYSQDQSGFLTVNCDFTIDGQDYQFLGKPSGYTKEKPLPAIGNGALSEPFARVMDSGINAQNAAQSQSLSNTQSVSRSFTSSSDSSGNFNASSRETLNGQSTGSANNYDVSTAEQADLVELIQVL